MGPRRPAPYAATTRYLRANGVLGNISTRGRTRRQTSGGRLGAGLGSWERGRGVGPALFTIGPPLSPKAHGLVHAKRPIRWFTTAWGRARPAVQGHREAGTVVLVPGAEPARGGKRLAHRPGPECVEGEPVPLPLRSVRLRRRRWVALRTPARAYGSCIEAGVSRHASAGTPALDAARSLLARPQPAPAVAGTVLLTDFACHGTVQDFPNRAPPSQHPLPQLRCPRARVRSCRYGDAEAAPVRVCCSNMAGSAPWLHDPHPREAGARARPELGGILVLAFTPL